jgi:hypothetical protein
MMRTIVRMHDMVLLARATRSGSWSSILAHGLSDNATEPVALKPLSLKL